MGQAEVAGVVGMRNDDHVAAVVAGVEFPVQLGQGRKLQHRDQILIADRPVEHVVVAAAFAGVSCPFPTEVGNEPPRLVVLGALRAHQFPLARVQPDIVFGVGHKVEPGVVARELQEEVQGADAFGVARVAVGIAPVDAVLGILDHQDRVRLARDGWLEISGAQGRPVDAGLSRASSTTVIASVPASVEAFTSPLTTTSKPGTSPVARL